MDGQDVPDEDNDTLSSMFDPKEKKKIQNRIAQRVHRTYQSTTHLGRVLMVLLREEAQAANEGARADRRGATGSNGSSVTASEPQLFFVARATQSRDNVPFYILVYPFAQPVRGIGQNAAAISGQSC